MTGAEFSEVDIDLLADYVGGALDGTPDEAVVAALITEDAAWRDAHARLSAGVATVTGQLQALGSVAEPMPADIFARLDLALLGATSAERTAGTANATNAETISTANATSAEKAIIAERATGAARAAGDEAATGNESTATDQEVAGRASRAGQTASIEGVSSGAAVGPAAMEPGSDGAAPARHLVAVPSGSRSKRARRLRWAAPVGIAAGVLAFVGFGFQHQFAGGGSEDTQSSAGSAAEAPAAPHAAAGSELGLPEGSARIVESGTDYRLATLGQSVKRARAAPDLPPEQLATMSKSAPSPGGLDAVDPLNRLRVQEALRACIQAIAELHGAGEIVPQTIDFARFDGAPAMVVEFTAADGSWVWASGPACGTTGVGAAKLGAVQVG